MQLKKIFAYFKGYVTLRVEGKFPEKFLNLALHQGINFFDAKTLEPEVMELSVLLNDFWELRHIARKVSCTLRIKSKKGFPFLLVKIKKRKMLMAGFLLFIAAMYFLSSFIWQVEVRSYEELNIISEDKVVAEVSQLGLKPGALKKNLDRHQLEKELAQKIPQISWVAIDFQGTKAIIKVVERVLPSSEQLEKSPAHVVAKKDGIIEEFLVMVGEPKVKVGDAVVKGQILISGLLTNSLAEGDEIQEKLPNEYQKVRAKGIVRATVWYQLKSRIDLYQVNKQRTGNSEENIKLTLGDKSYLLKGNQECSFKNYETENMEKKISLGQFHSPIKITKTIYHEVKIEKEFFSKEEALKLAERKLLQEVKAQLPFGAKILEQNLEIITENEKELQVKLLVKTIEDITYTAPF